MTAVNAALRETPYPVRLLPVPPVRYLAFDENGKLTPRGRLWLSSCRKILSNPELTVPPYHPVVVAALVHFMGEPVVQDLELFRAPLMELVKAIGVREDCVVDIRIERLVGDSAGSDFGPAEMYFGIIAGHE